MKKILFYLPFIKLGGLEKVAIEYMNLLSKDNKVSLIIDYDMGEEGNVFESFIPEGVEFLYIKTQRTSSFIYFFRTLGKKYKVFNLFLFGFTVIFDFYFYHFKVKKYLNENKFDTIVSFYQFLPSYVTNHTDSKHIIWLHHSVEHILDGIKKHFIGRFGKKLDKYDYIVSISDEMRTQLEEYYPNIDKNKLKTIYNPFNFDKIIKNSNNYSDLSQNDLKLLNEDYICTVTRIDNYQKDIKTLINSYKILYDKGKIQHKLYIIGDGPHRDEHENSVKNYDLSKQILFLGKRTNPYIWMKNADIFILSSKSEGLPTVLIEAMTVGTFVISSNCKTGTKEILEYGKSGDLFDVGDEKALSELVYNALNDSDYTAKKILNAQKRLHEFDSKCIFSQVESII